MGFLLGGLLSFPHAALAHSISGTVYGNGVPMPDAAITLFVTADGSVAGSTSTNAGGLYSLDAGDGSYYMTVTPPAGAAGYVPSRVNDVTVAGADLTQNVALVTESSLYGLVRLPDGRPVGGVRISLTDEASGQQYGPILAGADGVYRFSVPPGQYKYYLDGGNERYPGKPYNFVFSNAYRNTAVSGSTLQNVVLPFAFLSGKTKDRSGVAVAGVKLQSPYSNNPRPDGSSCTVAHDAGSTISAADGSYVMAQCDGSTNDINALVPVGSGVSSNVFQDVLVSGDTHRDFVLNDGQPLTGVVRFPDGTPVVGVRIFVIDQASNFAFGHMTTDMQGAYAFAVQSGTYKFYLDRGSESYPGRPLQFIFSDAYRDTVVSGPTTRDVTLPFAFLRGRTVDGEGTPIGNVVLQNPYTGGARADGSSCVVVNYYESVRSNADGTYSLALCDGFTYSITAVPPAGSKVVSTVFDGVQVAGDEARDFVLRKPSLGGVVTFPDGTPVPGVRVSVTEEVTGQQYGSIYAGDGGVYGFAIPDGSYSFYLDGGRESYPGKPYNFVFSSAYRNTVVLGSTIRDLVLPFGFLSGKTTDSNGVPVRGVELTSPYSDNRRADGSSCSLTHHAGSTISHADGSYVMAQCDGFGHDISALPSAASGFSNSTIPDVYVEGPTGLTIVLQKPDTIAPLILSGPFATAIGTDAATVVWQTDEPARGDATWSGGSVEETGFQTQHAVLLQGLTAATAYTVTVSATDRAGNGPTTGSVTFATASLPDTAPPLIVSGPTVSALTHESGVVEWETNEPATTQVGGDLAASLPGYRTLHRVELTGLSASTTYAITVSSTDVSGNGPTTRGTSFTTLAAPDVTPPVITKGPWATDVTSNAATIQWETDEPANSGVSYNDGTVHGVLNDDALTQQHSVRMTGLTPSTVYYVTVSSSDAFGNGPTLSSVFTVTTLGSGDTEPPEFLEAPQVCNINHQLVHLCFRTDEPASAVVAYGTSAGNLSRTEARPQLVRQHSIPINGLSASTTYYLQVAVRDQAGNERTSDVIVATTPAPGAQGGPRFVTGPTVSYQADERVVVEWETDRPCTALVEYGTGGYKLQAGSGELRIRHGIVVTNLVPGTIYQFRVRATDVDGNSVMGGESPASARSVAATEAAAGAFVTAPAPDMTPPAFSTTPAVRTVTANSALVTWSTGEVADSRVHFGQSEPLARTAGDIEYTTAHSVALTKLEPGKSYSFQVTSVDPTGNRTTSSILSFTTSVGDLPVGVPASRCGSGVVVLGATGAASGQDYRWYAVPEGGTPLQTGGASFTTSPVSVTTTYFVSIFDVTRNYESARSAVTATVRAVPQTPAPTNDGPYFEGGVVQLTVAYVADATWAWTGPNGFSSSLQSPTIPTAGAEDAGTYSVTATVNGCTSPPGTTTVAVILTPAISVTKDGPGDGRVFSNPLGISCDTTCSAPFAPGAVVTLTAVPDVGSSFTGWTGSGCSGTGTCAVTMSSAQLVNATFALAPVPPRITSFAAAPSVRSSSGISTLAWTTEGANSVSIAGIGGTFALSGTRDVSVSATTTYTLTATNAAGSVTATATVNLLPPAGAALGTPVITAPAAAQVINVSGVGFTWNAVSSAAGYDVRLYSATSGATVFAGSLVGNGSTSTLVTLPDGPYVFAVRACNASGFTDATCGAYATRSFSVAQAAPTGAPTITAPTQGATLLASTQTLSWTAVAKADPGLTLSYEVLLTDVAAGNKPELQIAVPDPTLSTIYTLHSSALYELKVRACQAGCGPWSDPVTFSVDLPNVPTTAPTTPSCNVTGGNSLTCSWSAVSGADVYSFYVVQPPPAGPGGGALTVAARLVSTTTVTLPVPQGFANVIVAACTGDGCGPYSGARGINPAGPNPSSPNLGTPLAASVVNGPGVEFSWNRIPGDDGTNTWYRLYVQDLSRQAAALDVYTNDNFYAAYFKAEGARYDALVVAHPGLPAQIVGPPIGFNVRGLSANAPTMVSPPHQSEVQAGNLQLGWSPVPSATLYQYWVAVLGQGTPAVTGVTPGLVVQVPLPAVAGQPTTYSGITRACMSPTGCSPTSDTGWGPWSNAPGGPGVTNFTVTP